MEINKEKILSGTPQKRFNIARNELMEEYTESNAKDFSFTYVTKPMSFILANSRNIFSESYYGLPFYKEFITKNIFNPIAYLGELDKIRGFLKEATEKKMPTAQLTLYKELEDIVAKLVSDHTNLINVYKRATLTPGVEEFLTIIFDDIYETDVNDLELLDAIADEIFSDTLDPYVSIPTGYLFCRKFSSKHPSYCNRLSRISRYHTTNGDDIQEATKRRAFRTKACIREMMRDTCTAKYCAELPNQNIYLEWVKLTDEADDMEKTYASNNLPEMEEVIIPDQVSAMEKIYEAVEESEALNDAICAKYDILHDKLYTYEAYAESLDEESALGTDNVAIMEQVDAIIGELKSEIAYMEWEDDGRPNAVIAKHNMIRKDIEKEEKEKESRPKNIEDISEIDALEIIDKANNGIAAIAKQETNKAIFKEKVAKIKKHTTENLREAIIKYPSVKDGIKKMNDSIDDYDAIFEDGEENDQNELDTSSEKPKKPKRDLATRIQDKALDYDAKMTKKDAERSEKFQKLKNAGKAIIARPKREKEEADDLLSKFDKWDDNRRKEFLIKPGNRHKIFKKLKTALLYGVTSKISLAMVPVTMMCRHFSKEKDSRIRNELQMELESEIKICEEKINDANSSGDNKSKYELMRIRDKLQAERKRVMLNSKYV